MSRRFPPRPHAADGVRVSIGADTRAAGRRVALTLGALVAGLTAVISMAAPAGATTTSTPAVTTPWHIDSGYFGFNTAGVGAPSSLAPRTSATNTLPATFFGTLRYWDDPPELSTRWCDIQPTAGSDIEAALKARLDPKLAAAEAAGVKRVIMVIGHPAPWVHSPTPFGAAAPRDASQWFCQGQKAAVAMPGPDALGTLRAPGPALRAWSSYVNQLMAHLNARYQGQLPFEVALQTFNEPNWMLSLSTGIAHTATTPDQAARALITFELAARLSMNRYPSMVASGLTLYTSPLSRASGAVGTRYLMLAEAAQAGVHVFDGVTFHTYSDQGSSPLTVAALIRGYNSGDLRTITQVVSQYPHLRVLPRHQTETNHAIATSGSATHVYSLTDQQILLSRLVVDGLRWGLRSQSLYTVNPKLFPLDLRLGADGRAQGNPTLLRTFTITRSWLVGQDFMGCRVSRGVVTCTLRNSATQRLSRVMWSEDCNVRLVTAPAGTAGVQTVSGARRAVRGGSTILLGAAPQRVY